MNSDYTFLNRESSGTNVNLYGLSLVSNYAVITEGADTAVLSNKTADIDAPEIISYRTVPIKEVKNDLDIRNPAKVTSGIQYSVQVQATLKTTDSDDPTFRVDEPIICQIVFRHPKSANFTQQNVETILRRAISALYHDNGTSRIPDLIRSAERPISD